MTKNELIANIAHRTGLTKYSCENMVDAFTEEIKDCLVRGDKITLKGFMGFEISERPEREGRNPKTGLVTTFPAVKTIKCKVSKAVKDAVNAK